MTPKRDLHYSSSYQSFSAMGTPYPSRWVPLPIVYLTMTEEDTLNFGRCKRIALINDWDLSFTTSSFLQSRRVPPKYLHDGYTPSPLPYSTHTPTHRSFSPGQSEGGIRERLNMIGDRNLIFSIALRTPPYQRNIKALFTDFVMAN